MTRVLTPQRAILWIPDSWTVWQHRGHWFTLKHGKLFRVKR